MGSTCPKWIINCVHSTIFLQLLSSPELSDWWFLLVLTAIYLLTNLKKIVFQICSVEAEGKKKGEQEHYILYRFITMLELILQKSCFLLAALSWLSYFNSLVEIFHFIGSFEWQIFNIHCQSDVFESFLNRSKNVTMPQKCRIVFVCKSPSWEIYRYSCWEGISCSSSQDGFGKTQQW